MMKMELITVEAVGNFLAHFGVGILLMVLGLTVFAFTTKFSEVKLIKEGNIAVALKLWGKAIGLGIVIYTVWAGSVNLLDAFIWGLVGIAAQVIAYWIVEYVLTPKTTNLAEEVEKGNLAVGFSLFSISIVVGLLVAASLTY
jgi:putative membrane protein